MKMKLANVLLLAAVFLLPWQTRWIFGDTLISGEPSQYGMLSVYLVEFILIAVLLLRGRPQPVMGSGKATQALFGLFAAAFFSLTFSVEFHAGMLFVLHLIMAGSLFMLVCDQRTNVQHVVVSFVSGLVIPSLLGWAQALTGISPAFTWLGLAAQDVATAGTAVIETAQGRWLRAYGSMPHPNIFGGYLVAGVICLAWITRFFKKEWLPLFMVPVVILTSTLILTFSRSAWLGLTIGFLFLLGLMLFRRRMPPRHAIPIAVLGLLTLLSTLVVFNAQVFARFQPALRVEAISLEERAGQYQTVDDVFFEQPIFGVGPAGYTFALARLFPGQSSWSYQPIHNAPLLLLSELGILGAAALFYWLVRIDQLNSKRAKTPGGMFGLTLGVSLLVISLFDHYPWSLWPGLALFALALAFVVRWSVRE